MQRIILATCVFGLLFGLPAHSLAAQIAVVDLQVVFQKSNPGKESSQILQEYQQNLRSDLQEKKQSLDNLKQKIQQESMMLSEEAKKNKKSKLQKQAQEFRSSVQQYQQKIKQKQKEVREPVFDVIRDVVTKHAEKNDYDLVMEKNSGVMYNKESMDITETIIQKLNTAWEKRDKEIESSKE